LKKIRNKKEFQQLIENFQSKHKKMPYAYALGEGFLDENENLISVRWINIYIQKKHFSLPTSLFKTGKKLYAILYANKESLIKKDPTSCADALCRLTMISKLKFKPNELNLYNAFNLLNKLYYTTEGAMTEIQWKKEFKKGNCIQPIAIDKFPPLWWGTLIPKNVRIADSSRVRLGAYLSPGTTVMHEGFVNFDAGTLGPCMVEGRISSGVTVGKNSDLGGGSSIMGTLSGGGKKKITIGENCLLGANSGTGISLGNRCTIEAGLYITSGMKIFVTVNNFGFTEKTYVKAKKLSGKNDMLLRRNSQTGTVELLWNEKPNKLNMVLH